MPATPEIYLIAFVVICMTFLVLRLTDAAKSKTEEASHYLYETRKAFFAAAILVGLGGLFLCGMIFYYFSTDGRIDKGKDIFDGCKTVIPPLVALVIGYFFGRGQVERPSGRDEKKDA
jgi:amino acid permease